MRLDKFLVVASVGTRQKVRGYVKAGLIKVNEEVVMEPALEIDENNDIIKYLGKVVKSRSRIYYMFNKPGGCITARSDAESKTVMDYFHGVNMDGIFHVGRLDKDTEGLLLLTNDGDFNNEIMYPEKHVEKTYYFWALGSLSENDKRRLEEGISIGHGEPITKPAKIQVIKSGRYKELEEELDVVKYYNMKSNHPNQSVVSGYITISEGRKHQVKRMLKAVGCYVVYLKRTSIGGLKLDENLESGKFRPLKEWEIQLLLGK